MYYVASPRGEAVVPRNSIKHYVLGAIPNVLGFITGTNIPIILRTTKPRLRETNLSCVIGIVSGGALEPWVGWTRLLQGGKR